MTVRRFVKNILLAVGRRLPVFRDVINTSKTAAPITFKTLFVQKILGFNRGAYWPVHFTSVVTDVSKIRVGIGSSPGISPGCYIQGINGIEIGDYTILAPNVGLISANHDPLNHFEHVRGKPIRIGSYCWIGMNAVILPGVELGDHTIVAAGAIVNRSFREGYCTLAGVPVRVVKQHDPGEVIQNRYPVEYLGFHSLGNSSKEELFERLGIRDLADTPAETEPATSANGEACVS